MPELYDPNTNEPIPIAADLNDIKKKLSSYERANLLTAVCTGVFIAVQGVFIALQWLEMNSGGKDTRAIAEAASKQANAALAIADQAKTQTDKLNALIAATNELAVQSKRSADVAGRSLDIVRTNANRDQRAWVGFLQTNPPAFLDEAGRRVLHPRGRGIVPHTAHFGSLKSVPKLDAQSYNLA